MKISKRGRKIFLKNHEIYESSNVKIHTSLFLRDDGCLFLYSQVFKYFGQYLNTGTVFGI